ncbi:unnamed protein product [Spirodela intermedia]|uniref:Glutamate receptor n=1 Tax=Spirodela intermedia TaxID=51605 RepID=A0A7I8JLM5_SPIIN|nr:unnamed protein product [Spirodela intermedia]CAA6671054.1 unnamed protein product [Spirodela intermedia]
MEMSNAARLLLFSAFCLCFCSFTNRRVALAQRTAPTPVHVGVILNLDKESLVARMCNVSLAMAVEDFYSSRSSFRTRLVLHTRNSHDDVVGAASAALDLIKNTRVHAIIGPLTSVQTAFVLDLGNKTRVPIVSFSASSPSLSPSRSPYFVRTTLNSSCHVNAIASIAKAFGWREVVPIYEDTEYGTSFLPYLVDALLGVDTRVTKRSAIPPSARDNHIVEELKRLNCSRTRVFVVHMLPELGSRLFLKAKELGMMAKGYVWITTDVMTDLVGTMDPSVVEAMKGVIGLKPYVLETEELRNFTARWKMRFKRENPKAANVSEISIYALWAYDTAWAMALAVEKEGLTEYSSFRKPVAGGSQITDLTSLGVSLTGPRLLDALLKTRFRKLSGEFRLVEGQLQSSIFQLVNVVGGKAREVGFWTPTHGVQLNSTTNTSISDLGTALSDVVWPGGSRLPPKGWQIPTWGKKLRIAVPTKAGFKEFVSVDGNNVTGFSIDVFDAVMRWLNRSDTYVYTPKDAQGENGDYDELVELIYREEVDAVVGDLTIVANRSQYADFTLPYTESGVWMIVPIKKNNNRNPWVFLKPLTTDLWLGSMSFFFFTGFVVWVIEHRINNDFRGPPAQQMGTIFYFAFSTMVYAHRERVESNLSRFVVTVWVFVVLILTSSYTASLTSMLTVQQLQPTLASVNELRKNGDFIGYQDGSFLKGLLLRENFDESKLKPYGNVSQYADALSKGSHNGGVSAIFDEIPYIRIFLAEHCSDYMTIGPIYKTDGFGFAFARGSPLVPDISRAILNITEGDKLRDIESKNLEKKSNCKDKADAINSSRLSFSSFSGLFLITGAVSILCLLIFSATFVYKNWGELKPAASRGSIWNKMVAWGKYFDQKDLSSHAFRGENGTKKGCDCESHRAATETSALTGGSQSPLSISVHSSIAEAPPEEGRPSTSSELGTTDPRRRPQPRKVPRWE